MTWPMAAALAISAWSAQQASDQAAESTAASAEAAQAQLEFSQQQYEDWKRVFGPIQENMAEYYSKLTPEQYAASGIQKFEREFQTYTQNIERELARRDLGPDSGVALELGYQSQMQRATQRADIRANAETEVQKQKLNFLTLGTGQRPNIEGAMADYTQSLQHTADQAIAAESGAWSGFGTTLNAWAMQDQRTNPNDNTNINISPGTPTSGGTR